MQNSSCTYNLGGDFVKDALFIAYFLLAVASLTILL